MKKRIIAGSLALIMTCSVTAHALVPVTDELGLPQWIAQLKASMEAYALQGKQFAQQNLSWLKQLQQYATQVQQYQVAAAELLALVHAPNLGEGLMQAFNMTGLGNQLPISGYDAMSVVNGVRYSSGGLSSIPGITASLNGMTSRLFNENTVYRSPDASWSATQMASRANGIAGYQAATVSSYDSTASHMAVLQGLRARLATETTPKGMQDLQAQISLEQTWAIQHGLESAAIRDAFNAQTENMKQRDDEKMTGSLHDVAEQLSRG